MNNHKIQLIKNTKKLEEVKTNTLSIIDFKISYLRSIKFQKLLKEYQKTPDLDKQIIDLESEMKATIDHFQKLSKKIQEQSNLLSSLIN